MSSVSYNLRYHPAFFYSVSQLCVPIVDDRQERNVLYKFWVHGQGVIMMVMMVSVPFLSSQCTAKGFDFWFIVVKMVLVLFQKLWLRMMLKKWRSWNISEAPQAGLAQAPLGFAASLRSDQNDTHCWWWCCLGWLVMITTALVSNFSSVQATCGSVSLAENNTYFTSRFFLTAICHKSHEFTFSSEIDFDQKLILILTL